MGVKQGLIGLLVIGLISGTAGVGVASATPNAEHERTGGDRDSSLTQDGVEPTDTPHPSEVPDAGESTPQSGLPDANEDESAEVSDTAPAAASRTIRARDLCASTPDGLVNRSGPNLSINLDRAGARKLSITGSRNTANNCLAELKTLTVTNSSSSALKELVFEPETLVKGDWVSISLPSNLDRLEVGNQVFYQGTGRAKTLQTVAFGSNVKVTVLGWAAFGQASKKASESNTLREVSFGSGLTRLEIGEDAFRQRVEGGGSNALRSIRFSAGLKDLTISAYAFNQHMRGDGRNVLPQVSFPNGLKNLSIGKYAFQQWTNAQRSRNSLKEISIPGNLDSLSIRRRAFVRDDGVQPRVVFRTSVAPTTAAGTISLDQAILSDDPVFYWEGKDNVLIQDAWKKQLKLIEPSSNGKPYVLRNHRTGPKPERFAGIDRYVTNFEVNMKDMKPGKPLFVATGTSFPDALSIGPAVSLTDGTLVLGRSSSPSSNTVNLIKRNRPSAVYIIGGTGAVSDRFAKQIGDAAGRTPKRIGGKNRYETSDLILREFFANRSFSAAFIATGANYPDALSAAAAGGSLNMPVLLVPGTSPSGALQPAAVSFLQSKNVRTLVAVGGPGVVSDRVLANVRSQGTFSTSRLAGANRYATNMQVNEYINSKSGGTASMTGLWVATGKNFPDALSAAGPAGKQGQRLVLSNGSCLSRPVVSSWIQGATSKVETVFLVGGRRALSDSVAGYTECR